MLRSALLVPVCLAVALVVGCAPGKSDIEKSIRDEMKTSLGVEITTVELSKQTDGSYSGNATAANGDTYEVTTTAPKGGKTEWKAIPGKAMVERTVREGMNAQLPSKVKTLDLTRQSPGVYTGTSVLESGAKFNVSTTLDGKTLNFKADPAP